ncbi:E3 ubiquitin-protein ligase TRIM39 isoform X2 [Esox lucius]|uniref:Bloodthirsty-related gene family, member 1 n=1 Tax=Esox lucius TaxID=8010 RepID=A0A3P8XY21_ESOLU|nr:E3 ubiquitin-protein ligase TRIM39 isoform X2 [Esox lucius]
MRRRSSKSGVSKPKTCKPQGVSHLLSEERPRASSLVSQPPPYTAALSRRRFTLTGAHDGDNLLCDQGPLAGRLPLAHSFLSEEQFQCAICLEIFVNPASTPCGHSFCMACIGKYWDGAKLCQCPLCKETFKKRPDLQINRTLREITEQFKSMSAVSRICTASRRGSLGTEGGGGGGGGEEGGGGGVKDTDHQENNILCLEKWTDSKTPANAPDCLPQLAVEQESDASTRVYRDLVCAVEKSQAELQEVIEINRRAAEHQAEIAIRQLEQEVAELRRRSHTLSQLAQSDDYGNYIQSYPSLCTPPPIRDWSGVSVNTDLETGPVYKSLSVLVQHFQEELARMAEFGVPAPVVTSVVQQPMVKKVQQYAVDVTLDSSTAHPRLVLSEDKKKVKCGDRHQLLPDNPERFDRVVCVLGKEGISSGRHYWEVEVGGKTDWDLGVASHSITRKGKITVNPSNGYWFLSLRDKHNYVFRTEPTTELPINIRPQKIGVFVDYEKGQISFYNVEAKLHIYTFTDTFCEFIYPFFSPCTNQSGKNDGHLIITPVLK